jgi:hypothetical protein
MEAKPKKEISRTLSIDIKMGGQINSGHNASREECSFGLCSSLHALVEEHLMQDNVCFKRLHQTFVEKGRKDFTFQHIKRVVNFIAFHSWGTLNV